MTSMKHVVLAMVVAFVLLTLPSFHPMPTPDARQDRGGETVIFWRAP